MTAFLKITRKQDKSVPKILENFDEIKPLEKDRLGISPAAALQICTLMKEKDQSIQGLRVSIKGGGCSGLSIHYDWYTQLSANDKVFEEYGAKVVIDKKSLLFLGGSTLHCKSYLTAKEFFLVNNPNAKQCSCGQSFSI